MFHCDVSMQGRVGTDRFDAMTALIDWVERGEPPAMLTAARVLPGCLVRAAAWLRYLGAGSTHEATSFACRDDQ
jgi:hypothetical protein